MTILTAGQLAINGALLNAYLCERIHHDTAWRARRAGYNPGWIETALRARLYAERTEWLLAEAERLERAAGAWRTAA